MNRTDELKNKLKNKIENLVVNENYAIFYFGGFSMFDELCWEIVTELKQKHTHIKRIFCLSDPRHQRASKRPSWLKEEDFEEFIYLDLTFDYWYTRIYYRNIEMINQSDFIIFYVNKTENSGAYKTMKYAIKVKKKFINMAIDNKML